MGLLGLKSIICLASQETAELFSSVCYILYAYCLVSTLYCQDLCVYLCMCVFHFNKCLVLCNCGFNLHFPEDPWCWTSFILEMGLAILPRLTLNFWVQGILKPQPPWLMFNTRLMLNIRRCCLAYAGHLFICLLDMCVYSLIKCCFKFLGHVCYFEDCMGVPGPSDVKKYHWGSYLTSLYLSFLILKVE